MSPPFPSLVVGDYEGFPVQIGAIGILDRGV
jgi:hypothetical protein